MEASLGDADDESAGDVDEPAGGFAGPVLHADRQVTRAMPMGRDNLIFGLPGFRGYKLFRR